MENPNFHLDGILKNNSESNAFDGPLSLILMLLSKNQIEIRDIRIADILDQYMDYLAQMQEMDLEIASEFVQMAAYLLYIKTRMLLTDEKEEISELEQLIESLEKLKSRDVCASIRMIIPELRKNAEKGSRYLAKIPEGIKRSDSSYEYSHSSSDLLRAILNFSSRRQDSPDLSDMQAAIPKRIVFSVKTKSRQLLNCLKEGSVSLSRLYEMCDSKSELVATFISILEMCSMGSVLVTIQDSVPVISYVGGSIDEVIDKIEE